MEKSLLLFKFQHIKFELDMSGLHYFKPAEFMCTVNKFLKMIYLGD